VGHAHVDIPQKLVTNTQTGRDVLLCEPDYWGMRLAVIELDLERHGMRWSVSSASSQTLNSNVAAEDPEVAAAVRFQHDQVVAYVNTVIGTSTQAMSAARAPVEDVPIIDFVNYVQADAVKQGLTGADASLPVLSIAAPFNRGASFPAGDVSRRDVAGLYIYDNFLFGVKVSGQDVTDYLEYSMRYFKQVPGPGTFAMADVTNAVTATAPNGTPDYNFDTVAGLDAPLSYDVDIAQAVGSRVTNLQYAGNPVLPTDQFALAVNNYRQSGGGGFPAVSKAPVIYSNSIDIRQLLIDWVGLHHTIDPTQFASVDWRLVANGQALTIT
jgi:2',3'-cyclic-nucleotide 2'-phosphodiesterase/3'-nucleotidase